MPYTVSGPLRPGCALRVACPQRRRVGCAPPLCFHGITLLTEETGQWQLRPGSASAANSMSRPAPSVKAASWREAWGSARTLTYRRWRRRRRRGSATSTDGPMRGAKRVLCVAAARSHTVVAMGRAQRRRFARRQCCAARSSPAPRATVLDRVCRGSASRVATTLPRPAPFPRARGTALLRLGP